MDNGKYSKRHFDEECGLMFGFEYNRSFTFHYTALCIWSIHYSC